MYSKWNAPAHPLKVFQHQQSKLSAMKKNRNLISILLATSIAVSIQTASAQSVFKQSVFFATDQDTLQPEAQLTLARLTERISHLTDFDITIEAWTDDQGTIEYNQALSARRAAAVNQYLARHGCKARKVAINPLGKSDRLQGKTIADTRRLNRRVDVTVTPNLLNDFEELTQKAGQLQPDQFTVQSGRASEFISTGGVRINVPADAFVLPDGASPKGPVTLIFTEATQPTDWIINGLSTHTSDGQLLETAGMYRLEASAGSRNLQLREGVSISFTVPLQGKFDPEMELFYGVSERNGNVSWQAAANGSATDSAQALDVYSWRRYSLLDSLKYIFESVEKLKVKKPKPPVFSSRRLKRSSHKAPTIPRMHEPVEPERPIAQASFSDDPDAIKSLREKNRQAMRYYYKKMRGYRAKQAQYRRKWNAYRRDSIVYEKSSQYRDIYLKQLRNYENSLHAYLIKQAFNARVAGFHRYYPVGMYNTGLKGVSQYAHYNMLSLEYRQKRNPLRRQLRQPVLGRKFTHRLLDDGLKVRYCNDPEEKEWLRKGDSLLTVLCESSGYNKAYADVKKRYEQLLEESAKKATENVANLSNYTFEAAQLGWINIDKFWKYPEADRVPVILAETAADTRVFVIFREFRGALALPFSNGKFVSSPLPKNTPVTVVALKLKDGSPQLLMFDTRVGESETLSNSGYETLTLKQLQEKLANLNG